ncbi:unnamed protein product [Pleuronectes platessa]|uniref:Uncharacterized protein n=1 Tax=Pleuronectes platessa TaxID=8262 RepID=A0A9N7VNM7_PLEPL|nr:unnamed protein product [Pleuronectes platessa]
MKAPALYKQARACGWRSKQGRTTYPVLRRLPAWTQPGMIRCDHSPARGWLWHRGVIGEGVPRPRLGLPWPWRSKSSPSAHACDSILNHTQLPLDKDGPVPTAREILTQPQLERTAGLSGPGSSSPSVSWEAINNSLKSKSELLRLISGLELASMGPRGLSWRETEQAPFHHAEEDLQVKERLQNPEAAPELLSCASRAPVCLNGEALLAVVDS